MIVNLESAAVIAVLGLLGVGLYGLLVVRNAIKLVAVLQVLAKSAILAMILAGHITGQPLLGQSLAVTIIVADTIVAVIGLALAIQARRFFRSLDTQDMNTLRG